ncbi:MAG: hypothetical protein FJ206_08440 [Gemmatimonadetes bacterium]|nr:hypothetical protein [Gemmatimonadota bacterium]
MILRFDRSARRLLTAFGSVLTLAGCGKKEPIGPTAGQLAIVYSGPSATDGAMLLVVTGGVDAVTGSNGYRVASGSAGVNTTRVVVTGSLAPGELFKISVKDVDAIYTARLEAVADRNTFALTDPSAYQITVAK